MGNNMGKCIEKMQASSESIGEWYVCETYKFENNVKTIPTHNSLYANYRSIVIGVCFFYYYQLSTISIGAECGFPCLRCTQGRLGRV